jgi:hypothetical protein
MRNRLFSLTAAIILCAGMTGCGEKSGNESAPQGTYVVIKRFETNQREYMKEYESNGLDSVLERIVNGEVNDSNETVKFSSRSFELKSTRHNGVLSHDFSGKFSVKNGEIVMKYTSAVDKEGETVSASDKFNENEDRLKASLVRSLNLYTERGGYYGEILQPAALIDRPPAYYYFPCLSSISKSEPAVYKLKLQNDFLCTDAFGCKLDGSYQPGEDFTIQYDRIEALNSDPNYILVNQEHLEQNIAYQKDTMNNQWNTASTSTTVSFSNGVWEWKTADGNLINNGVYQESKQYPGLIAMTLSDSSAAGNEYTVFKTMIPVFLYVNEGKVYSPCLIKTK